MAASNSHSTDVTTSVMPADEGGIARAVELLTDGEVVAVPTETVYGLAADASNEDAVAKIYAAKGRPDFNPLIVHVRDLAGADALAELPDAAIKLAARFWPGPLTIVAPRRAEASIAPAVTAGLATIALRCPAHPAMRALLEKGGMALAAPSANRSGRISPTQADHVRQELEGKIRLILDGGPCAAGLESTIVGIDAAGWRQLRPGPIDRADIASVIGMESGVGPDNGRVEAPGQLASHYAPRKPVRLNALSAEEDEWLIGFGAVDGDENLSPTGDGIEAAANLYAALRRADAALPPRIAVAPISGAWAEAINDRLKRASAR